ncbi:MAG TPA: hypothetical protein VI298_14635 [Geobacteraceae bacterium]
MKTEKGLNRIMTLIITVLIAGCGGSGGSTNGGGTVPTPTVQMGGAIQGRALSVSGVVTTLAGTKGTYGSSDGIGVAASLCPEGLTTDGRNLFVADGANFTIRKVEIATGVVTTLAGSAGNQGCADGTGAAARFSDLFGITTDGTNLYVTDSNNTIRKIEISTGIVTTIAGSAGNPGSADGTGSAARFLGPQGITTDNSYLYVSDSGNLTIRKIKIATGEVTTIAGSPGLSGSTDGTGSAARFRYPAGITTDGTSLYLADIQNNTIRKINISTEVVTTIAGVPEISGSSDGVGSAATFFNPQWITTDGTNLYVADFLNATIRKIEIATCAVTTLVGVAGTPSWTDGTGTARYWSPQGLTTDGTSLFVADNGGTFTISKIY